LIFVRIFSGVLHAADNAEDQRPKEVFGFLLKSVGHDVSTCKGFSNGMHIIRCPTVKNKSLAAHIFYFVYFVVVVMWHCSFFL
jgi:hypothetical protein